MPITSAERNDILSLVVGIFDAAPGQANLATLVAQFEAGQSLPQMAADLAGIPQFSSLYAASLSNAQFIDLFHANLVGGEVAAAPLAWARGWNLAKLESGISRGQVMLESIQALAEIPASNSEWANAKAAHENKIEVAHYYSITKAQSSPSLSDLL